MNVLETFKLDGKVADMLGTFGCMGLYGTKGHRFVTSTDTFIAFKSQLVTFIEYLRTGLLPFDFDQTIELMKIIIAGIRSRDEGGCVVTLTEIQV